VGVGGIFEWKIKKSQWTKRGGYLFKLMQKKKRRGGKDTIGLLYREINWDMTGIDHGTLQKRRKKKQGLRGDYSISRSDPCSKQERAFNEGTIWKRLTQDPEGKKRKVGRGGWWWWEEGKRGRVFIT